MRNTFAVPCLASELRVGDWLRAGGEWRIVAVAGVGWFELACGDRVVYDPYTRGTDPYYLVHPDRSPAI